MSLTPHTTLLTAVAGGARVAVRSALGQTTPMAGRLRPGLAADH